MGLAETRVGRNESQRRFIRKIEHLRGATCLRALSEAEACHRSAVMDYATQNLTPNGVDSPDLRESNTKTRSESRKTLLYLGRFHPKKNISMIRAWNEISNSQRGNSNNLTRNCRMGRQGGYEGKLGGWLPVSFSPAIRRGQRRMLSRVRRIHPAVIERRASHDGA